MAFKLLKKDNPVPRECPVGGVFHIIPATGFDVNRIGKIITKTTYLKDERNRTVFVQEERGRRPIPKNEIDPERVVDEALKRCPQIDDVEVITVDTNGNEAGVERIVDPEASAAGLPAGTVIGIELRRDILSRIIEVPPPPDDDDEVENPTPEPAPAAPPPVVDEDGSINFVVTGEADEEAQPKKKKVPRSQMCADWVLSQAIELGEAQKEKETKNS